MHLLDVNVLLALCDPTHLHHASALDWFTPVAKTGWATCPITENGFVRIQSSAKYPNSSGSVAASLAMLLGLKSVGKHKFISDSVSLTAALPAEFAMTGSQVTDVYLLSLAVHSKAKFASFDRAVPVQLITGGKQALVTIKLRE